MLRMFEGVGELGIWSILCSLTLRASFTMNIKNLMDKLRR